jgi:FMNH2-dependent dimethyl sulfone monooxygenase
MSLRIGLFYPNFYADHALSGAIARANMKIEAFETHKAVALACEDAGFDYVFMADGYGPYGPLSHEAWIRDPLLMAPLLAMTVLGATRHLRCITTVHTSWHHPLTIARMGATLDSMSNGRWGINIVSGQGSFGEPLDASIAGLDHDLRYERAAEAMEIMTQAWTRSEVDFAGKHFQAKGLLVGPSTVQKPRPLVVSAGASEAGRAFAGRYADYTFLPGRTPKDELLKRVSDMRRIAIESGRRSEDVKVQVHASICVRETAEEARGYSDWVASKVELPLVHEYLNAVRSQISTYDDVYKQLGELQMRQIGSVSGARKVHGSANEVADHIEMLHREFKADGIVITLPLWSPDEIRLLGRVLMPRLAERGIWEPPSARDYGW